MCPHSCQGCDRLLYFVWHKIFHNTLSVENEVFFNVLQIRTFSAELLEHNSLVIFDLVALNIMRQKTILFTYYFNRIIVSKFVSSLIWNNNRRCVAGHYNHCNIVLSIVLGYAIFIQINKYSNYHNLLSFCCLLSALHFLYTYSKGPFLKLFCL